MIYTLIYDYQFLINTNLVLDMINVSVHLPFFVLFGLQRLNSVLFSKPFRVSNSCQTAFDMAEDGWIIGLELLGAK